MTLSTACLILPLFYYVIKALYPDYVLGRFLYPALLCLALLMLLAKGLRSGRFLSSRLYPLVLLTLSAVGMLYIYVPPTAGRLEASLLSQYFGVVPFLLAFYALFAFTKMDVPSAIRTVIVIVSIEAIAEFVMLNVLGMTQYLIHYDETVLSETAYAQQSGAVRTLQVSGLLANRSNTSVFLVALYWFHRAFVPQKSFWPGYFDLLAALGFLACMSGSGMAAFAISVLLFRGSFRVRAALAAVCISILVVNSLINYSSRVELDYFAFMFNAKLDLFWYFQSLVYERPSILLVGLRANEGADISSDMSIFKTIMDVGLTPFVVYFYLVMIWIKSARRVMPAGSVHLLKLAIATLVVGTFHYPTLFAVPVQAFLGALAAWAVDAAAEQQIAMSSALASLPVPRLAEVPWAVPVRARDGRPPLHSQRRSMPRRSGRESN